MASKNDRDMIGKATGISKTIGPNYDERWGRSTPKPISTPNTRRKPGIINPYTELAQLKPSHLKPSFPVEQKTFLSKPGIGHWSRNSKSRVASTSQMRDKGKGRAKEPPPQEIIDVDADPDVDPDPVSTDDLDLLAPKSPTTSHYFGLKEDMNMGTNALNGSIGASLVRDGKNTTLLRKTLNGIRREPQKGRGHDPPGRFSSPITQFSDDEVQIQDDKQVKELQAKEDRRHDKPPSVKEMVASIERKQVSTESRRTSLPTVPVLDFKKLPQPRSSIKNGMRAKGPGKPSGSRPPNYMDLENPPRQGNTYTKSKAAIHHLPVSRIVIGDMQSSDYETVAFQMAEKSVKMVFENTLNNPIGPIELTPTNFKNFKVSAFYLDHELSDSCPKYTESMGASSTSIDAEPSEGTAHLHIFHFTSSQTGKTGDLENRHNSVFKLGDLGNQRQIAIKFNTSSEKWNAVTYNSIAEKIRSTEIPFEILRPSYGNSSISFSCSKAECRASATVWTVAIKFRSGEPPGLFDDPYDSSTLEKEVKSTSAPVGRSLDTLSSKTSSRKPQVEQLQKYRYSPASDSAVTTRKRSSDSGKDKQQDELIEVTIVEPPSKRRRVEEQQAVRRSSRQQEKTQKYDADEVILVYPWNTPGAVNLTTGDLARLDEGEFLNDNIIEFGLKSWLQKLEAMDSDLASKVYVFNSFFYKKLNKRNIKDGYDSVRKWTSKVDIFQKKYIIVPINENLHWYLAIIYEPEHALQTPLPSAKPRTKAVTRKQAREVYAAEEPIDVEAESSSMAQGTADNSETQPNVQEYQEGADGENSENEVEMLALSSCSLIITDDHSSTMSAASEVKDAFVNGSVSASRDKSPQTPPGSPMNIDIELPRKTVFDKPVDDKMPDATMHSRTHTPVSERKDSRQNKTNDKSSISAEVTPARFYRKLFIDGQPRRKSVEAPAEVPVEVPVEETTIIEEPRSTEPRTRIFILDSLGNRHPQAMKQLNKWLELEAMDKKGIESVTPAISKMAPVPVQPNFCDCGVYILHFAKTFMTDPQKFFQIMMKERPPMKERIKDWKDHSVSNMRAELRHQILVFSEGWREKRAAREKEKEHVKQEEEEDEDSDVAIVEHVKAPGKKGRSTKSSRTKT
ncbi:hypothetical protein NP233_g5517 [Leucocoprinus birnbaumii]|uniref:Ubiquitin-like protease family profile domain-containing protein n=1 Tax=Leucocoprinus birnbaumii TaxID=56174 RepID=A0AAD5VSP7_9AGAR|nr:hypothetical protein NP233_g5517 [Leucocoprinus birnbaumii]